MKLTKLLITLILSFSSNSIFSQIIPNYFTLDKNELSKALDSTPSGNAVEYIEFMDDDVWIATSVGLSKSTDGGENWTNYKFGDEGISALGINKDTVWVATWHPLENSDDVVPVGSGLHYSPDKGETWIDIPQPVDAQNDSSIIYGINTLRALPIPVVEGNFTRSIAFTPGTIWIASFYGGFRKSNDNGQTWQKVVVPPDYLDSISPFDTLNFTVSPSSGALGFENNLNHRFFSLKAINDSTLLIGTANGINLSTDNGISWRKFNHQNQKKPISGNFIISLDYDFSRNIIWAASWKAEGASEFYGLSSSSDLGKTWDTFLPSENIHDIAFTFDSDKKEQDVLVATNNGVFRSSDLGKTWIVSPEIKDDESNTFLTTRRFRAINCKINNLGFNEIWFGSESGSALLTETKGLWEGSWKVFLAAPAISLKSQSIAFPNPFSPDNETIKIKYIINGSNSSVTLRIFDFGMNLVKTVLQNVERASNTEIIDIWNGRDENNNIVPNGVYFYRIDIGTSDIFYGKIMVLM